MMVPISVCPPKPTNTTTMMRLSVCKHNANMTAYLSGSATGPESAVLVGLLPESKLNCCLGLSECGEAVVEFAMNHCFESVAVLLCTADDVVVDGMEFALPLLFAPVWPPPFDVVEPPPPRLPLFDALHPALPLLELPLHPLPELGPPLPPTPPPLALPMLLEVPTVRAVVTPLALTWPRAMAMGLGDESGDEEVNEEICAWGVKNINEFNYIILFQYVHYLRMYGSSMLCRYPEIILDLIGVHIYCD